MADNKMRLYGILILAGISLLVACGDKSNDKHRPAPQAPVEEAYQPPQNNLLINPDFESSSNGALVSWLLSQHTGAVSYKVSAEDGVVRIERIDSEPWGMLTQTLRPEAVLPLQGKRLRFSAELKAEFNPEYGAPFEASGMGLLLTGVPVGQFSRITAADIFEPVTQGEQNAGWRRYSVELDIPDSNELVGLRLQMRFVMADGGVLNIRRPYLIEVPQGE
jgi:hypothetical protein